MQVILRADVASLGKKGDIIDVTNGYARNYLLPQGLALHASKGAIAQAGVMRKSRDIHDARARAAGEDIAKVLVPAVITIGVKSGAEGRLFGSVTANDVVEAVQAQTGIELDRRKLHLAEPIKTLGTHQGPVKLHADVEFAVTLEVVAG